MISRDELGNLAQSFNQMVETLKERDRVLEEEKEKILGNVDFLSMMVHDVKAPIAGVRLMTDILLEEEPTGEIKPGFWGCGKALKNCWPICKMSCPFPKLKKAPLPWSRKKSS